MLLDKPTGISSARAVAQVKRLLPKKTKIGHTGTLDPLASGLLILLTGRATRLSRYVTGLDKTYTATARFGAVSDTLDAEGKISELDMPMPTAEDLQFAARDFIGDILQTPPMASAVKVGGERLYNVHRRGETVERESRPVTIHSLKLNMYEPPYATFEVSCSSGTYVRTLISDLANSLGTGAYLSSLRRNSVGNLDLDGAKLPEEISEPTVHNHIIQPSRVVEHLPAVVVNEEEREDVLHGRSISSHGISGSFRVQFEGELLAIYRGENDLARPEVVLCPA